MDAYYNTIMMNDNPDNNNTNTQYEHISNTIDNIVDVVIVGVDVGIVDVVVYGVHDVSVGDYVVVIVGVSYVACDITHVLPFMLLMLLLLCGVCVDGVYNVLAVDVVCCCYDV